MNFQLKALLSLTVALAVSPIAKADYLDGNMGAIQSLAQQMNYQTTQARQDSERYANYNDYAEQDALNRLRQLEASADNFARSVDNNYYNPSYTVYEYNQLSNDYQSAQGMFARLTAYRYVLNEFNDLQNTMQSLRYYYNGQGVPYPTPYPVPAPYPRPVPYPPYNPYPPRPYPGPVYPGPVYPGPGYPGPVYPGNPGHYPGQPNPPAHPVYPGPSYPGPVYPGPVYPGPVYPGPTPGRPAPGNPGHFPGQPNPPARPVGPGRP